MILTEKKITRQSHNYKEIVELMKRAFPKEELMPMWLIHTMTMQKNKKFSAFYDKGLFVGILFTIEKDDMLFVFYIAVNDKVQSKGYGSKLLQMLIQKYNTKAISLFVETLDPKASNYEQRVKRFAFYERNGFFNSGIKAGIKNSPFIDILSTDKDFSLEQCKKMVRFTPLKIFPSTIKAEGSDI